MKQLLVMAALLLLPQLAGAENYSWTDSSGNMNFTDNLGNVPAKYRRQAVLRAAGSEPEAAPQSAGTGQAESAGMVQPSAVVSTQMAPGAVTPATRFGNHSAAEWQAQFKTLRAELAELQKKQAELRQEASDGKVLLNRKQIDELNARNRQLYEQYEATRLRFNVLVEQANKVGVPPEFAQ